jgi:hypothetical protein
MKAATLVAVSLLALAPLCDAACPDVTFSGPAEWYGGQQPASLAFANIDRDRWPDLVVAGYDQNAQPRGGITVLLGDGGQTWPVHQELVPSHNVLRLVAADFDGDGDDDIAYLQGRTEGNDDSGRHIRILMNGNGVLAPAGAIVVPLPFLAIAAEIVSGDFNGDGHVDLVLAGGNALLFTSRGDGTFQQTPLLGATDSAGAGDLDGDGYDELVISATRNNQPELLVYHGGPNGLAAPRSLTAPYVAWDIKVADVDGDGARDVVASRYGRIDLVLVLRAGFADAEVRSHVPTDVVSVIAGAVADLNGDGRDDLTYVDSAVGLKSLLGAADARLVTAVGRFIPRRSTITGPSDVDAADVDADGDPDVAVITEHGFAVLENERGVLESPPYSAPALATGDFNRDGRDDVVWHDRILLAGAGGTIEFVPFAETGQYDGAEVADMNRDGLLDVVYFSIGGRYRIRLGNGDGTFRALEPFRTLGNTIGDRAVADFDGDGNADVLVLDTGFPGRRLLLALGDGQGGISGTRDISNGDAFLSHLAAGDLDGDGDVDLAFLTANRPDNLLVSYNDGTGSFTAPVGVGTGWDDVEMADMNGDDRLDLVTVSSLFPTVVRVYGNQGGGGFTRVAQQPLDTGFAAMHVADFNGDRILDVLVMDTPSSSTNDGWMSLYLGTGTGVLLPARKLPSSAIGRSATGDFNGDGRTDVMDGSFVRLSECPLGPRRRAVRH